MQAALPPHLLPLHSLPLCPQFKAISVSYNAVASPELREKHDEEVHVRSKCSGGEGGAGLLAVARVERGEGTLSSPPLALQDFKRAYPGKWKPASAAV